MNCTHAATANSVAIEGLLNFTNYRDFDPLPDGSGWIMLAAFDNPDATGDGGGAATPQRIDVVLNWIEELEQRVPRARQAPEGSR